MRSDLSAAAASRPTPPTAARHDGFGGALAGLVAVAIVLAGLVLGSAGAPASGAEATSTLWGTGAPANAVVASDTKAVELGTAFTATVPGQVLGVRFWKASQNTGTHVGNLWSSNGTRLASATFTGETASGWQTVTFSQPVTIAANTRYVVSYFAPNGRYSATSPFTGTSTSPHLAVTPGSSGVYTYAGSSTYPRSSWNSSQYWVDLVFQPTPSTDPTPIPTPSPTATVGPTPMPTPMPTPTPTTSPTPTPTSTAPTTGCATVPSACGFPDATNTGVQDGVVLREVPSEVSSGPGWYVDSRGWVTVHGNGAVLENLRIPYTVDVTADNVTIRNVQIRASGETSGIALRHADNTTITDTEILPPPYRTRLLVGIKDVYGDATGTTVARTEITRSSTGIQIASGLIQDNFIHDLAMVAGDHVNGTTSNGGTTRQLTIRHNTILNHFGQTDAVSLFQDFGTEENRLIEDNLLAGGGYTIYGGANPGKEPTANIVIRNNRISTIYFPRGGSYGPVTAFNPNGVGNVWSGNVWDESGVIIPSP